MSNHHLSHLLLVIGNQLITARAISEVEILEEYDREDYVVDVDSV
jgi:hypothetical protein